MFNPRPKPNCDVCWLFVEPNKPPPVFVKLVVPPKPLVLKPVLKLGLPNPVVGWLPKIPPVVEVTAGWVVVDPNKPPVFVLPKVEPLKLVWPPNVDPNGVAVDVSERPVVGWVVDVLEPNPPNMPFYFRIYYQLKFKLYGR